MEREKVIELAQEAGFKYPNEITENPEWSTYADRMYSRLLEFARLVEQETLERAAKAVEAVGRVDMSIDGVSFYATTGLCAKAIRNLKDNHDKE